MSSLLLAWWSSYKTEVHDDSGGRMSLASKLYWQISILFVAAYKEVPS